MTDKELKKLKDDLWHSADMLREGAHLSANKYGQLILGLIFLRYADILYKQHKSEIEEKYNKLKGTRMEKSLKDISVEVCGFYLPKEVYGQLVPEEEPELLSEIVRVFKDIPENISIDLFGEIYEFFLGSFALKEGQDGGIFYTPATVVRYMVEVLQPTSGDKMILEIKTRYLIQRNAA